MKPLKLRIILISSITVIASIIISYFLIYSSLKDERIELENELEVPISNSTEIELTISNFEENECIVDHCVINDCSKSLNLDCKKLLTNEFNGLGEYVLSFNFGKYLFYPWSDKTELKEFNIKLNQQETSGKEIKGYIDSLRKMLDENYLWEVHYIPISKDSFSFEKHFLLDSVDLTYNYTKSLYLLSQLAEKSEDSEIKGYIDREIEYLNTNANEIISSNKNSTYPPAYIIKLLEIGLDEKYLSLISNPDLQEYNTPLLREDKIQESALLLKDQVYEKRYQNISMYADYYQIFAESDYQNWGEYFLSLLINEYNGSEYSVYGLCTVIESNNELLEQEVLFNSLEELFENEKFELIEGSITELVKCRNYAQQIEVEIDGLEDRIDELLQYITLEVNNSRIIVRGLGTKNSEELKTIVTYSMLDNLIYILSYEE